MRVLLGIGNQGNRYQYNRHNVGFMFLDYFANKNSLSFTPSKGEYYFAKGNIEGNEFILVKPTTYVNNSGLAALDLVDSYDVDVLDVLVIYDDVNLDVAKFRVRASGGDGGHNGVSSIIYHLATNEFPRIRIGIGNDFENGDMANYVLSDFNNKEFEELENAFHKGTVLLEDFIKGGIKRMLDTNSKLFNSKSDNQSKGN